MTSAVKGGAASWRAPIGLTIAWLRSDCCLVVACDETDGRAHN